VLGLCDRFKVLPSAVGAESTRLLWLLAVERQGRQVTDG
jgi:hypothetical protein